MKTQRGRTVVRLMIQVTAEDIAKAYNHHIGWGIHPEWTPIAIALRRYGLDWKACMKQLPEHAKDHQSGWAASRRRDSGDLLNRQAREYFRCSIGAEPLEKPTRSDKWVDYPPFTFTLVP